MYLLYVLWYQKFSIFWSAEKVRRKKNERERRRWCVHVWILGVSKTNTFGRSMRCLPNGFKKKFSKWLMYIDWPKQQCHYRKITFEIIMKLFDIFYLFFFFQSYSNFLVWLYVFNKLVCNRKMVFDREWNLNFQNILHTLNWYNTSLFWLAHFHRWACTFVSSFSRIERTKHS